MSSAFAAKKQKILQQLAVPDASYTDLSPKGSVDEGIRGLVDEINELDTLVTTSSCAGRIAVYLEGRKQGPSRSAVDEDAQNSGIAAAGGKGGGQWLFVSHDPLTLSEETPVASTFGLNVQADQSVPASIQDVRWVRCKFEPMILHVLCSSIESAQKVHAAALQSGFRESGISSISADNLQGSTAMVAVRTTGLAFDSVIGYEAADGKLVPMVTEAYMRVLVELGNERFQVNKERTERFRGALFNTFRTPKLQSGDSTWEPIEQRKARMREEGLRRKAEAQKAAQTASASETGAHNDDESLGFGTALE